MKNLSPLILLLLLLTFCATSNSLTAEEVIAPLQESEASNSETEEERADLVKAHSGAYESIVLAEIVNEKCGYQDENNVKVLAETKQGLNIVILALLRPDLTGEQLKGLNIDSDNSIRRSAEAFADEIPCGPEAIELVTQMTTAAEPLLKGVRSLLDIINE